MLRSQKSVMQFDGSDDDDDVSIMDDDDNDMGMEPVLRSGGGRGLGRGGGFGGSFGRGGGGGSGGAADPYSFDVGGGADPYSFEMPMGGGGFQFDSKAPWGSDGLDLDGGTRRKGAPAPAPSKQASAAAQRSSGSSVLKSSSAAAPKAGGVTAYKLDDDKFKKLLGPGSAASKPKAAAQTFDQFLMSSDDESDGGQKPMSSNAPGAGRAQGGPTRSTTKSPPGSPDESEESPKMQRGKTKAPIASSSAFAKAASALNGDVKNEEASHTMDDEDESELSSMALPPQQASRPPTQAASALAPAANSTADAREDSASPAQTPRAGFARGGPASPTSSHHSSYRASSVHSSRSNQSDSRPMGKVMQMSDLLGPSTIPQEKPAAADAPQSSTLGKVMQMGDLPHASATSKASSAAALVAAAVAEVEEESSASQVATYDEDFVGESTAQGVSAQVGTYADDFEDDASGSSTPPGGRTRAALAAIASTKPKLLTLDSLPTTPAKATVVAVTEPVAAASSGARATVTAGGSSGSTARPAEDRHSRRRRPSYSEDGSDDDYRPRRPTCSVGIQAAVPVSVGVQTDLQQEPRLAPDDPFGPWMQSGPATAAGASGAAGFPAVGPYGPPQSYCFGGFPLPYGCAPAPFGAMPSSPYATMAPQYYGGYTMPQQVLPQQSSFNPQLSATNPLLRQLFGAAIAGPRVGTFNPPARGAAGPCEGETSNASSQGEAADVASDLAGGAAAQGAMPSLRTAPTMATGAIPASAHPMAAAFGGQVYGMPFGQQGMPLTAPGSGAAMGAPSPAAMAALGLVDQSFKEQIELLRKAAARHRSLLEKAHVAVPAAAGSAAVQAAP